MLGGELLPLGLTLDTAQELVSTVEGQGAPEASAADPAGLLSLHSMGTKCTCGSKLSRPGWKPSSVACKL